MYLIKLILDDGRDRVVSIVSIHVFDVPGEAVDIAELAKNET